jgi:aminopeptidase N
VTQAEPVHWLQVPITIEAEDGASVTHKLNVKSTSESFRFEMSARPARVALDPKNEALRVRPKHGSAPDLLAFQTLSGPLLVVVGAAGSAEESVAAQELASRQAKQVFPFASITVRADTEVSQQDLATANVLLVGSRTDLRIPKSIADYLALDRAVDKLVWRGREWSGSSLWAMEIINNPYDSRFLVGHVVAVSPAALKSFHLQGDLDARKGFFVVQDNGKPVASEAVEPIAEDVVTLGSDHVSAR